MVILSLYSPHGGQCWDINSHCYEKGVSRMFDDVLKDKKWPLWKRIVYLILVALPLPL
ncbi:hypothetical protein FC49_GL001229 [Limosilactobacillus oris DSM 4864]|uniref:Uncharacterized protein n=1 Tax=Limosilactobacillus oris DSM 4864 TaxID=1423779 RepID=A0A0R1WDY7_9LACO|nr:hypothetical protein FC49_GL001229 [Limosilactobacillus oris DSM 4864]